MAQFSVNAQRFDPYKNFKFRVKWDGRYVAGVSKVGALKRTTEVVEHREGGDPSSSRKSPGRTEYEAITLERGVTHDTEFEKWANKVWNFGSGLGAEVSLKDFRKDIIIEVYNEAGQLASPTRSSLLGLGVPGAARPRRQRQRRRHPAHQARERRLGARLRRDEPSEPTHGRRRPAGRRAARARLPRLR
jgi:phage tail-like protein